ncbi:MAG: ABC transporter substrate-binding protein, partial [Actinobacteria bacterium]|nr:ABC transporter substrate-binding protein [Actinomycetota bacterium]
AGGTGTNAAAKGKAGSASGATSSGGATSGFHPRKVGKLGPGVGDNEIKIGFQVAGNLGAGFALVGATGSPPEERQIVETFVDYINKTGGLAGRKVVPIIHETDPTGGTWATQAAAACATFTEDNKVLIVGTSVVGGSDALYNCLSSKGVPEIEQNLWLFDHTYYTKPGLLYQPGRISPDRWAKAYVDGLVLGGYFDNNPKVGLVRFDAPVFQRVSDNVLKPQMKAHGLKFTDEIAISSPESIAAFSSVSSQVSNAILRLRNDGVTNVMFLENAGILPFLFMPAAESQGYRPRYGLSSSDIPATQEGQVPKVQLKGSVAVGWLPGSDVGNNQEPADNPAAVQCFQLTQANFSGTTGFYRLPPCDTLLFLRRVLDVAPDLTVEGIRTAAEQLGTSYDSPVSFANHLAPGRYDGGDAYRLIYFDDGCTCYRFTGGNHPMPQ